MSHVYTVINQKGGVGKTTTAHALAGGLFIEHGYKTLSIDMDPQRSMTKLVGANEEGFTAFEVLTEKVTAADAIQHTEIGDMIAGSRELERIYLAIDDMGKEYHLKEALEPIRNRYDFIIIDTPPARGILTVNALTACDSVIIPTKADAISLGQIDELAETIQGVKKYCNSALAVEGILLTIYRFRYGNDKDYKDKAEAMAKKLGTKVFNTQIREAVAIQESQGHQMSIYKYRPYDKVTEDYRNFIAELVGEM